MADLPETEQWEAGIYQLEETDPVQGGENGVSNVQAKQLANRTAFLKKSIAKASKTEAEAGTNNDKLMTPLRTAEAIAALAATLPDFANNAEAEAGTNTTKVMSPKRTAEAIAALADTMADLATKAEAAAGTNNTKMMTPLRTKEAIDELGEKAPTIAAKAEAEAGANNTKMMTPLRTKEAIDKLALGDTFEVASEAAMLALSAKKGDVAVRGDTSETYRLAGNNASVLAEWVRLAKNSDVSYRTSVEVGAGKEFTSLSAVFFTLSSVEVAGLRFIYLTDTVYANGNLVLDLAGSANLAHIQIRQINNAVVSVDHAMFRGSESVKLPTINFSMNISGRLTSLSGTSELTILPGNTITASREILQISESARFIARGCTITFNIVGSSQFSRAIYTASKENTAHIDISESTLSCTSSVSDRFDIDLTSVGTFLARNTTFDKITRVSVSKGANIFDARYATFIDTPLDIRMSQTFLQHSNISFPTTSPTTPIRLTGTVYLENATGDFSTLTLNTPSSDGIIYG